MIAAGQSTFLVEEWSVTSELLPRNFRTVPAPPDGRAHLVRASGSGQFSAAQLRHVIRKIPSSTITIIDLRQESHGFINNGEPIFWYRKHNANNRHKELHSIEHAEQHLVHKLIGTYNAQLYTLQKNQDKTKYPCRMPGRLSIKSACTESELVSRKKLGYMRFAVGDAHAPHRHDVDRFVRCIRQMPAHGWLHMHCRAGRGRTTTFLTMYDCILNASILTFAQILKRQEQAGGVNMVRKPAPGSWKRGFIARRVRFIEQFYRYCRVQSAHNFEQSWSDWLREHALNHL
jgi:hypothetical protein